MMNYEKDEFWSTGRNKEYCGSPSNRGRLSSQRPRLKPAPHNLARHDVKRKRKPKRRRLQHRQLSRGHCRDHR
jgi:hypothetical protein